MNLEITSMDHLGRGMGKINNKVIFVPKSIPGDIIDISIYKDNKTYNIAKINHILRPSNLRINPKCPYYNICGGCHISNLSYQDTLNFKRNKVINIFKKYLDCDILPEIIPSNKKDKYRNKITYHYNKSLGLISEYDNNVIDIDKCYLVGDKINNLFSKIKKEDISKINKITIKECDNGLLLDIDGYMNIDNLKDKCLSIYMNNKRVSCQEDGYIVLNNLKYIISHKSFFQINTSNICNLYNEIIKLGNFNKNNQVIDLYCGVGSISLYISKYVKSVLGIEIIEEAVKDAKKNALINNIDNVEFICMDANKLDNKLINGDILIVDPPRMGINKHLLNIINNKNIKKIIYVSCDPMTLVRDLKLLTNYKLEKMVLVDMFPNTYHVECVLSLSLKALEE